MSDEQQRRRDSDYAQDERYINRTLEEVKLASNSALTGVNEMRLQLQDIKNKSEARDTATERQMDELKKRLDKSQNWLAGLCCGMALYLLQWAWQILQHAAAGK